ncbi:probable leucine-rich repeat receptor-like protein kinase At1g35710 [Zingiber officinale]|uniref:probable leucine-rich repeat receptor-like protein kinase At1g35710 n=1 Tax=Zingiber officinale TaxID=94328 RepID=UPI001C4AEC45|nr:probable leucine-rich repeat receptor-like protein kinase At1g35710 [Zingiber officinale]
MSSMLMHRRRRDIFMLCWLTSHALCSTEAVKVVSEGCSPAERDALLLLKAGIRNSSALLSSWAAQADCCAWSGVVCRNRSGDVRVAELNLQNPNAEQTNEYDTALSGELLNPSLSSLTALRSLNLSYNDLGGAPIPAFVGSLRQLRVLDLRWCNFAGNLPPHLGNLTNLRYLDLKSNSFLQDRPRVDSSLDWLKALSSLTYLDMSDVDLSAAAYNWVSTINSLPALRQLKLFLCNLDVPPSLDLELNLTSLTTLDLSLNRFHSTFPNWLWNLTGLLSLQLGNSRLQGQLPPEIGNLINLVNLDLSLNSLHGPLPTSIWKLKNLANLDLSFNFLGDSLPTGIMNLSSLSTLNLANCSLTGPIPTELGNLTTLKYLYLDLNSLSGRVPGEIGKLLDLAQLDLSANSLRGNISEFHISNLTRLQCLFLFDNPL